MAVPEPLEVVDLLLVITTALLYAYVGRRLGRRDVEGEARLAWRLFVHWWYGLSAMTGLGAVTRILHFAGVRDGALYITLAYVTLLILTYILWALLYYLVYLFTGDRRLLVPISVFYVGFYVFVLYLVAASGLYYDGATDQLQPRNELPGWLLLSFALLLVGPHIIGGMGYLRLFFKTEEPTQRYRIAIIAVSIVVWFSTSLVGRIPVGDATIADLPFWLFFTRLVGLAAAVAILLAYTPPRWVRERFGVLSIDDAQSERSRN